MTTAVWINSSNGHNYAEGPEGMTLNGVPCDKRPDWATGKPQAIYGPLTEWGGGECPVKPDTLVRCLFRGRRPYMGPAIWSGLPEIGRAGMWQHFPHFGRGTPEGDIIAYQVRVS